MATQRIGASGPSFGTIDETYGIFENIEFTTDVEETELLDGDSDVTAVDQHTKRTKISGEFTYKADSTITESVVGNGSAIAINSSDSDMTKSGYVKSYGRAKSKGDYMKIRFEATSWPNLGS